uniref:Kelch motif domain-containing protein n=2 Tax=Toxoplasma gondii TaxID=5811 RepID=A0A0F7UVT7_TOXGV|nr:putative kelch repeat protein [Toxoplasma gondii TgCATBr9]CEL72511.1 TPA: kelch motif domain-containing protein [Toxoplasma gondii VEG]
MLTYINSSSGTICASHLPANAARWRWARPLIEGALPPARGGHTATLVYDRLFVFGGHRYGGAKEGFVYYNDLHVLHLKKSQWLDLPRHRGTAPLPRYGHSAVLVGRRIIIFGGKGDRDRYFSDLHALDTVTLTWYQGPQGQPGCPSPRFGHSCNLDGPSMYIFGGVREKELKNDLLCMNLQDMTWSQPETSGTPPCPRYGHASLVVGRQLIVCGGMHRVQLCPAERDALLEKVELKDWYLMDLAVLDMVTFTWYRVRTHGNPPAPRFGHTMAALNGDLVVFGGWAGANAHYGMIAKHIHHSQEEGQDDNQVHDLPQTLLSCFSTATMTWETCSSFGNAPKARYGHSCTQVGSKLIIFGGWDTSIALNDVVVLCELKEEHFNDLSAFEADTTVAPDCPTGTGS